MRDMFLRRGSKGSWTLLIQELEQEDPAAYFGYVRMNKKTFDSLLEMIEPAITGDSRYRQPISARERLYLTLRKKLARVGYKFPDKQ
jgi:hypothetical protein